MDKLNELMKAVVAFRDERGGGKFHTPRNLTAALAIEAAELQELLLWKTDKETAEYLNNPTNRQKAAHEIADVLTFTLLFCHATGIDPIAAVEEKLAINAKNPPVELSRGNATKYTDLPRP